MEKINLNSIDRVHFIGIGGIGVSAAARMMLEQGKQVSGSDLNESSITKELERAGARVSYEHRRDNLPPDAQLVVHTIAAEEDNPELQASRENELLVMTYPQFLGLISRDKYTVAVAGTHGKTTTTAMLAIIAEATDLPSTTIVGSILNGHRSNFISTGDRYLFLEACEYRRSFLELSPQVLIITNIEAEHLDYYKDLSDVQSAFCEFVERVPEKGAIITDPGQENIRPVLKNAQAKIIDHTQEFVPQLSLPGRHNVLNAQAALAAARFLGAEEDLARKALSEFAGTWRRFEYKGVNEKGAAVYDDYAHHPTEIRATIEGFREKYPDKKLLVLFHPHLISRTVFFMEEFADALSTADESLILPVYQARGEDQLPVSNDVLADKITARGVSSQTVSGFSDAIEKVIALSDPDTVVVTMGAGDVYKVAQELVS